MKRTAAIAVISLAMLGACSADKESDSTASQTPSASTDSREYVALDGTKFEFDRLGALPEGMTADLQARMDKVVFEPDAEAYAAAAATAEGAGPDLDNYAAFKNLAAEFGQETGKYFGGVIRLVQTCDDQDVVTWGFAPADKAAPMVAECGSADAKADAQAIAETYVAGALGGPDAWVVLEQNSAN